MMVEGVEGGHWRQEVSTSDWALGGQEAGYTFPSTARK